jgi:hypothetical protein
MRGVWLLVLVGCSSSSAPASSETDIKLSLETTSKDTLRVGGTTNLPDGAVIGLQVSPGNSAKTAGGLYAVKARVLGGSFFYEFSDASRLPRGPYLVEARFALSEQDDPKIAAAIRSGKLKEKTARTVCNK